MRQFVHRALLAACLAGLATPALADSVTVKVSYADLDLTDPADVDVLHDRLATALRQACNRGLPSIHAALQVSDDCVASGLKNGEQVISEHRDRALAATP